MRLRAFSAPLGRHAIHSQDAFRRRFGHPGAAYFIHDKKNGKKWGVERIIAKFVLKLPQNVCLQVFLSRNYVV